MFQPYYNFQQPLYNTQSSYQNSYQQSVNLIRVTGYDGAKAYQMPPNSTTALFDSNDDLMYIKTTDGAGFPTIRTFRFEELRQTQMSVSNGDFISREEFEEFKTEVLSNGKQSIQSGTTGKQKSTSNSSANDKG